MYDLYSEPVRTVDVAELRLRLYYLRIVTYMGKSQGWSYLSGGGSV